MLKIDAHHHLWQYQATDYPWISDEMQALRRDFTPLDFASEMPLGGITYSVAVQASQTLNHTRFLLNAAKQFPFIQGVVGWVPLIEHEVEMDLEHFSADTRFRAVRHVLHDEPDDNYMLRPDFNRGIALLRRFDLAYDVLIFERHLPQTIQLVDSHPQQVFVIDHLAKPRVREGILSPWNHRMVELAKRPNVYCKISGLATEGDHSAWTEPQLMAYIDVVLEAFGPQRVMFGSDWPVCLLAISYQNWTSLVTRAITKLSAAEQARIWSGTAVEAYKLSLPG